MIMGNDRSRLGDELTPKKGRRAKPPQEMRALRGSSCPPFHCPAANEEDWRFAKRSCARFAHERLTLTFEFALAVDARDRGWNPERRFLMPCGVDTDSANGRDWYVATTVVQRLATNVGQCVLCNAGYDYKPKAEKAP